MTRAHLFEFEDQSWLPAPLRDAMTTVLRDCLTLGQGIYAPVGPIIAKLLAAQGSRQIVDLCSGAGGPWASLLPAVEQLAGPVHLTLTDKYPNRAALEETVTILGTSADYQRDSVDATAVHAGLRGVRTLFTGFHHFPPAVARQVLADAFHSRAGIGVFEFTARSAAAITDSVLNAAPRVYRSVLRARPPRLTTLLSCFPLPVLPLLLTWDAVVSDLRTYSPEELRDMVSGLQAPDYRWEIDVLRAPDGPPITALAGIPQVAQ
ncbi:hypothetical protein [Mycobacterium sp. NPDC050853]|uniref:hypothetical protein n=1 Tax=Mycobacterium sp. NPDC050853 TaxID=3155160 RepID=UPI0033E7B7BE